VNGDGRPDLVVVNQCGSGTSCSGDGTIAVLLGNGDGTFQPAVSYDTAALFSASVAAADLNGDGKLDLVVANFCAAICDNGGDQAGSVSVLLGNGDGTFQAATLYSSTAYGTDAVAVADVNGDGKLDIAVSSYCGDPKGTFCAVEPGVVTLLLGNGDGTFQSPTEWEVLAKSTGSVKVADVNGDGKPDIEVSVVCATDPINCASPSAGAGVLLGNGDGTFQTGQYFGSIGYSYGITPGLAVADVDGDGRPDLVVTIWCADTGCSTGAAEHSLVGVLINTSTFPNSAPTTTTLISSPNPSNVGQSVTFTATVSSSGSGGTPTGMVNLIDGSISLGVFSINSSGIATAAIATLPTGANNITAAYNGDATHASSTSAVVSQVVLGIVVSPAGLNFGGQNIRTTSGAQTAMLTNTEKTSISISSISIIGPNSADFAQTNNCPSSLPSNASCSVSVTFTPAASGAFSANLAITDSLPGSPQVVALSGTGVTPPVSLSPSNITFPAQYVGTSGLPQTVKLTNNSLSAVTISSVTTSPADFGSLNACGSSLAAGTSCSIGVFFDPTQGGSRSGVLTVTTNQMGQLAANLAGSGQDFSLASASPSATVMPGQSATYTVNVSPMGGFNQTVSLSCSGAPAQSTCSLSSNSVVLNGTAPAAVTVTVVTAGNSANLKPRGLAPRARDGWLLGMALFGLPALLVMYNTTDRGSKRRARFLYAPGFLCLTTLALSLFGCGGSSGNSGGKGSGGISPNSYNLSVTGSFASGSTTLTHSAKLILVVQ
jgi:hypothetical protein